MRGQKVCFYTGFLCKLFYAELTKIITIYSILCLVQIQSTLNTSNSVISKYFLSPRIQFRSICYFYSNFNSFYLKLLTSWSKFSGTDMNIQGSLSPKSGAKIRSHSQSQKVCFFPNSRWKIPNLTKCVWSRKIAGIVIKYIKSHLKLNKISISIPFYIRKCLKSQLQHWITSIFLLTRSSVIWIRLSS